jgi:hypothetical protein
MAQLKNDAQAIDLWNRSSPTCESESSKKADAQHLIFRTWGPSR